MVIGETEILSCNFVCHFSVVMLAKEEEEEKEEKKKEDVGGHPFCISATS